MMTRKLLTGALFFAGLLVVTASAITIADLRADDQTTVSEVDKGINDLRAELEGVKDGIRSVADKADAVSAQVESLQGRYLGAGKLSAKVYALYPEGTQKRDDFDALLNEGLELRTLSRQIQSSLGLQVQTP